MFDEVVALLGGFQNFILCLVIGLLVVAVITLVGFTVFGLEHPFLGWFALFLNDKRRRTVLVTLSLIRLFYLGAMVGMVKSFGITHILVYVLFSVAVWGIELNLFYFLYDLIYSAGAMGISYLLFLMHTELSKVHFQSGMRVLTVLFSCMLIVAAVGQFFIAISPAKGKSNANKSEEKMKKLSLGILPCLFLVLIVPYFMLTYVASISLPMGGIQFSDGEVQAVEAGSELTMTEEGCMVSCGETSYMLKKTPVYDKKDGSVIFTEYCSIVRPKLLMTNRINPMCKLEKTEGVFCVTDGERVSPVEEFFLFDGLDTYYFPEATTLTWGEETVVLSSFSKVEVLFNQTIEIFDYEKELYSVYEGVNGACIATMQGSERIDLSTDILYRENGEEQMLFSQPILLPDLE